MINSKEAALLFKEPFSATELKWKPQSVKGNQALAVAFVDARCVCDRLDEVVGIDGWQDQYEVLNDGCVICRLSVKIGDGWVVKMDVGNPSEQPDSGDRLKASFSDALKRAAIKFGIGRYIYSLPKQWCEYDNQKKRFVKTPTIPNWALPSANNKQQENSEKVNQSNQAEKTFPWDKFVQSVEQKAELTAQNNGKKKVQLCSEAVQLAHSAGIEEGQRVPQSVIDKVLEFFAAQENSPAAPPVKPLQSGKTVYWSKFTRWIDDNVKEVAETVGLDVEDVEQAAYKVAFAAGAVNGKDVSQSIADQVESYFSSILGDSEENNEE